MVDDSGRVFMSGSGVGYLQGISGRNGGLSFIIRMEIKDILLAIWMKG